MYSHYRYNLLKINSEIKALFSFPVFSIAFPSHFEYFRHYYPVSISPLNPKHLCIVNENKC